MKQITSSSNAHFKIWRTLLNSRGIKTEGLFILSGEKVLKEFLKNPGYDVVAELILKDHIPLQTEAPLYELSKELFNELDIVGTRFNLLILKTKPFEVSSPEKPVEGLEVIIPVGDPSNLGALIRSCVAFGVSKIHLTTESANPYHPKALKASAGSILHAPLFQAGALINWDHKTVWALDGKGISIEQMKKEFKSSNVRFLVGEEGPGVPDFKNVGWVSIPTQNVESLNATVAASLVIYSWRQL